ncbi:MAG: hypothetical protein JWL76_556 [Thermoleophilia bacterium]|nr:hypothetical protein [Thermoleophilia bacterium]
MQLAPTTPIAITPPRNPNTPSPIGVASFGELRIGHALNGISYTDHKLVGPLSSNFAEYSGSLQDAIVAATAAIKDVEMRADGRIAVALLGMPGHWVARPLFADSTVMRAIDNGAGHGGIASIQFTSRSRSLAALVTSGGSLLPGQSN